MLAFVVPALLFGAFADLPNGILLNHVVHLSFGAWNIVATAFLRQDVVAKAGEARGASKRRRGRKK